MTGLLDYGVNGHVDTSYNPNSLELSIGLLTSFSTSIWSWFVGRLGAVSWTLHVTLDHAQVRERLTRLLEESCPQLVFIDEGVRLQASSPIWSCPTVLLVVAVECWKGRPMASEWKCTQETISHRLVGGVTSGVFQVHLARRHTALTDVVFVGRPSVKACFGSILDETIGGGTKCGIPADGQVLPLGQDKDGLLHWDRRFGKIEAPSVFSKTTWVRRRLGDREVLAVLDLKREHFQKDTSLTFFGRSWYLGK